MYCFPNLCYKSKICDLTDELDILSSFLGQVASLSGGYLKDDLLELIYLTYISIDVLRDQEDFPGSEISSVEIIRNKYSVLADRPCDKNICPDKPGHFVFTIDMCRSFSEKIKTMYYDTFGEDCLKNVNLEIFINILPNVFVAIADYLNKFNDQI